MAPPDPAPLVDILSESYDESDEGSRHDRLMQYLKELRLWYWKLSSAIVVFIVFAVWAVSGHGFARSNDVSLAMAQILAPLNQRLDTVETAMREQETTNKALLGEVYKLRASSVADRIRQVLAARCRETVPYQRDRLRSTIDELQNEYAKYAGVRYVEPPCQEL